MMDSDLIPRHWVEIREESEGDRIVLRSFSSPIPPARGRRSLVLDPESTAQGRKPGLTDRLVPEEGGAGFWSLEGDILTVSAPGWEGRYKVEELSEDRMTLIRQ